MQIWFNSLLYVLVALTACSTTGCERSRSQLEPFESVEEHPDPTTPSRPGAPAEESATNDENDPSVDEHRPLLHESVHTLNDGWEEYAVSVDGQTRGAAIYRPARESEARVYFFHGYGHNAVAMARGMGITRFAERYHAELVFAEGLENEVDNDGGRRSWNAGACCAFDHPERDDVGFVRALDAQLRDEFGDRPTYGIGFSNGGFFLEMIACRHPEMFDAVTSVAGSMSAVVLPCATQRGPVRVQRIAGTDDLRVPLAGGAERGRDYLSFDADYELWRETLGCSGAAPDITEIGDARCEQRTCEHGQLRFCLVDGMGHNWPTLNGRWRYDTLSDAWQFWTSRRP